MQKNYLLDLAGKDVGIPEGGKMIDRECEVIMLLEGFDDMVKMHGDNKGIDDASAGVDCQEGPLDSA